MCVCWLSVWRQSMDLSVCDISSVRWFKAFCDGLLSRVPADVPPFVSFCRPCMSISAVIPPRERGSWDSQRLCNIESDIGKSANSTTVTRGMRRLEYNDRAAVERYAVWFRSNWRLQAENTPGCTVKTRVFDIACCIYTSACIRGTGARPVHRTHIHTHTEQLMGTRGMDSARHTAVTWPRSRPAAGAQAAVNEAANLRTHGDGGSSSARSTVGTKSQ